MFCCFKKIREAYLMARFEYYGKLFNKYHAKSVACLDDKEPGYWAWSDKCKICLIKRDKILRKLLKLRNR